MTLSRPRKRRTQTSSSSGRENSAASENRVVDPDGVEEEVEIHLRGCSQLPPAIPNEEDRPLIRPEGKTHWREIPRLGKERRPASVLTCLLKSSRASLAAAKHQRREREEYERRQSTQDARVAKEYAQQMLEWSRSVHNYNSSMQRFMENVAQHTGMPCTAIPLPPPPPPPPTFGISASPNPSPQNAHTIGSATGEENPDETLSRIAQGMFGGYVNASGSAGGSYSPDLDGGLTPF